jgi:hypothetical protein
MAINTLRGVNTSSPNFNENPDFWYDVGMMKLFILQTVVNNYREPTLCGCCSALR